ncbi:MAG TPA: ABC transporter ATP-binding protein, partial [candidate division WOR-3 bacterium]|nr:ABC transporter ATP-binding protein [candidate division WOR-3 bacterium]
MKEYFRLLSYLRPHLFEFFLAFVSMLIFSALEGLSMGMLSPILKVLFGLSEGFRVSGEGLMSAVKGFLNRYILDLPPLEATRRLALLMVILYFFKSIFAYLQRVFSVMVQEKVTRSVRNDLFSKILELPYSFFSKINSGEIISKFINDVNLVREAITSGLSTLIRESMRGTAFLVVAFIASWKLTFISLILVPLSAALIVVIGRKLRKRSQRAQEKMGALGHQLSETLGGIKVVKGFGTEEKEFERFRQKTQDYYRARMRFEYLGALGSPLTEFLSVLVAAFILLYGARLIFVEKSLSPDGFLVFLAAALSLM